MTVKIIASAGGSVMCPANAVPTEVENPFQAAPPPGYSSWARLNGCDPPNGYMISADGGFMFPASSGLMEVENSFPAAPPPGYSYSPSPNECGPSNGFKIPTDGGVMYPADFGYDGYQAVIDYIVTAFNLIIYIIGSLLAARRCLIHKPC